MAPRKTTKSEGIRPQTFSGLNKKRFTRKSNPNAGLRLVLEANKTIPIQMLDDIKEFKEFERHVFQENGRWAFVPCAGKKTCPLCHSDNPRVAGTGYAFIANVLNLENGKVQVLEGGSQLATKVHYRYERKPSAWKKRTFEVTEFNTKPKSWDFAPGEEDPRPVRGLKKHDLDDYILSEMKRYYGDDLSSVKLEDPDLDDDEFEDDDEDFEDDIDDDDELEDEDLDDEDEEDDDLDDEDEEDLDDEDDDEDDDDLDDFDDDDDEDDDDEDWDDDDDEDEEPAPRRSSKKSAPKKSAPKKAAAKKTAAKKTTAKKAAARKSR